MTEWATRNSTHIKRFIACIIGGVVLAAMWSPVEGSTTDFYYELNKTERFPRLLIFLAIGVVLFLLITFWSLVKPYVRRPGVLPAFAGLIVVIAGYVFMHWNDNVGSGKFSMVARAVDRTNGLSWVTKQYYGWLHWAFLFGALALCAVAVVLEIRVFAWAGVVLAVLAALATYKAHQDVASRAGGVDHSLGWATAIIGYLVIAGAGAAIAVSHEQIAASKSFVNRVLGWRPGLPLAVVGLVLGLLAFLVGRWFAPQNPQRNNKLSGMNDVFGHTSLTQIAKTYLNWLAWVLLAVCVVLTAAGAYLRNRLVSSVAAVLGIGSCVLTIFVMYKFSDLAARLEPTDGTTWNNLGSGAWMAAGTFLLLGGGALIAVMAGRNNRATIGESGAYLVAPGAARSAIVAALAFALFFPPTMTGFWQQVLVTEIGPYLLLAVGLNVVVGWAGLLDLGYIAFFAVGCYFTAYLTGSLAVKPPDWLILPPLAAIPFAILVCALAGLILGAPTLRLRGDYLAIVTLGFGEIIQLAANNGDDIGGKNITNGSRGTGVDPIHHVKNVPHPSIHIGPLNVTWGENQLQYWYLLFVYLVILVLAFRGLEHSRIGRAWAAIREDEVAAEASGINTFRVKLLAFAIGASSSGVAGVFYGSQVGFFSPTDFTLIYSILVVAYVVFGGMGSLVGALAGAAALTWLPRFLQDQVPPADKQMWIGAIVVLMMIFRPAGLIPAKRRRIELADYDDSPHAETYAVSPAGSLGGAS